MVPLFFELLTLLDKIPTTFWGVLAGSLFSLGGVLLSNRANDRRHKAQLDHDRALRNRERELSLRKDVYLAAAEAISVGLTTVGRFADLSIPHNKLMEGYVEKSAAITKVHVIAKEETARALTNFTVELGATYLRLFAKRYPLVAENDRLKIINEQVVGFGKEQDRMLELMKQYNIEGTADPRKWKAIQDNFDFEQKRASESIKEHETSASTLLSKQLEYMKECSSESTRLGKILVPLLVAVRSELELPISETAYAQIIEDGVERQQINLGEFLQSVAPLNKDGK